MVAHDGKCRARIKSNNNNNRSIHTLNVAVRLTVPKSHEDTYVYIHAHIHTYINTYINTYTDTYMHPQVPSIHTEVNLHDRRCQNAYFNKDNKQ